jgi:hypothetical protein
MHPRLLPGGAKSTEAKAAVAIRARQQSAWARTGLEIPAYGASPLVADAWLIPHHAVDRHLVAGAR